MDLTSAEYRILIRMSLSDGGVYPTHLLDPEKVHNWTLDVRQTAMSGLLAKRLIEPTETGEHRITEAGRAECVAFEAVYPGLAKLMPKGGVESG